jgi:transposase
MRLPEILKEFLPTSDARTDLPAYRTLLVLLQNILVAREPIYGLGQWAARFAPDLLDLWPYEVELLNDDRAGRALHQMFDALASELTVTVVRRVIDEFHINLDELHNDSTSVSFYGAYQQADEERQVRGQRTLAITFGHSKDHRPDLKQLLFILTVSEDGAVPIYFTSASGNTSDDTTHCQTWDLLCKLAGRNDFLYVADCKLASSENMNYIARKGRFITVLPRSRKEDKQFRKQLLEKPDSIRWDDVYTLTKKVRTRGIEQEVELDRLTVACDQRLSSDGYRLLWYHSTKKVEHDAHRRARNLQRATCALRELRERLRGLRTRFDSRKKVDQAVQEILKTLKEESLLIVDVDEHEEATYRQASKGRPSKNTKYVKQVKTRFDISWSIDQIRMAQAEATDGIFPLISNVSEMTAEEILRAYKRQPIIEKRFSQFKTDFAVAPIYLKSVTRIQGLMAVYFLALIVQT